MKNCSLCRSPHRAELEMALLAQRPLREIAKLFGTSTGALSRHRGHIAAPIAKAQEVHLLMRALSVGEAMESYHLKTQGILADCQQIAKEAAAAGDPKLRLAAMKAALDTLSELRAQLSFRAEVEKHRPSLLCPADSAAETRLEQMLRELLEKAKARKRGEIFDVRPSIDAARNETQDMD